uniref:Uncharacterized protein n=1 Tax=Fagus sylvatica TaxID=28930 RepID=A0A2N9I2C5_FAGSY
MAKTKKTQGKLARYVNTPEAMERFRRHYGVPDDVHLAYRFWEDAITGEPRDLIIPLVAVIEGGVRFPIDPLLADFLDYFQEKKKQVQAHLTDPVALQAVYDSEVYVDEYANPRSAFKLLRYIPSARSFLLCRQVRNLAEALANPANQSPPAHDIKHMAEINLKKLLPPTRPQAETSEPVLPLERKRKRKGPTKGEAPPAETPVAPVEVEAQAVQVQAVLPGVDTLPSAEEADVEMVGPFVPGAAPDAPQVLAPVWVPTLEAAGERVRTDATVLRTEGSGSNTATALCEVARLPGDMMVWRQSTNQEVINNLRRGLMMAVQGSLEMGDRFQRQAAELENALKVRIATLKKDEANLKVEETEDLLRNALDANSKAEDKFKALEAEIAAREKAAFDRGQAEAQSIMTKQLPGIYNEAFQEGWKALYSWPDSDDMPGLPPQESLPYSDAPIGVPEEELPDPLPALNDEAGPSYV